MEKKLSDEAVFRVAFGIEAPELRQEYLRQVSANDPAQFDRVNALLEATQEDPEFLESPAPGVGRNARHGKYRGVDRLAIRALQDPRGAG